MTQHHAETKALITGGTQGLGLAIAKQLIAEGAKQIVVASRDQDKGARVAAELTRDGVQAHFIHVDMADTASVTEMVDQSASLMGQVTSLVNCAATTDRGSILDTTPELWDRIMDTNAKGAFFALQRFSQLAIKSGIDGTAVNILSVVVHAGLPWLAPYAASKAALLNITKNAANTLAKDRIRVNGINVGWMDTPGEDAVQKTFHEGGDDWLAKAEARMPFGQLVKPEHVAKQVSFLLGTDSGVVTGSIIDFDQRVIGAYPDTNE